MRGMAQAVRSRVKPRAVAICAKPRPAGQPVRLRGAALAKSAASAGPQGAASGWWLARMGGIAFVDTRLTELHHLDAGQYRALHWRQLFFVEGFVAVFVRHAGGFQVLEVVQLGVH